jgi:hypothetical protein
VTARWKNSLIKVVSKRGNLMSQKSLRTLQEEKSKLIDQQIQIDKEIRIATFKEKINEVQKVEIVFLTQNDVFEFDIKSESHEVFIDYFLRFVGVK